MNHEKVEVSAILETDGLFSTLAISPDGRCFVYSAENKVWSEMNHPTFSGFQYWNRRAYEMNDGRRIFRGIFTIKVATNG